MKKTIIILVAVLIGVYLMLSLVCRDKEYAAEKLFYRTTKAYNKIRINPEATPPRMLANVTGGLEKIISDYPDTRAVTNAHMSLAEVYFADKKYDKAIEALNRLIATHDKEDVGTLSKAHFLKALAYEQDGKWNDALKEFKILKDTYVNTPLGLQAPLYVAVHYQKEEQGGEAEAQYKKAVAFYKDLRDKNVGTILGYAASGLVAQAYMGLKDYDEAGEAVKYTILTYPTIMTYAQQLPNVELIYVKLMNEPEKAIEIYKNVMKIAPDAELKKALEKRIKELEASDK